jgi:pyruvate,water dikinase
MGFAMLALAGKIVKVRPGELQTVLRGLPNNITTEMDMAMWDLAQEIRRDPVALRQFQNGERPAALDRFLARWGHRAVAEIDLGLPRWSDDPTHVIGVVRNFLRVEDENAAPDVVFARGAAEAEAMIETLARRAWGRGWLVRFALRRTRLLAGLREYPKYLVITLFGALRKRVSDIGAQLVADGRLDTADDVFFLNFEEMRSTQGDLRAVVAERREVYDREMRRRHIPRVLLSDGTEPEAVRHGAPAEGDLVGTPASAGTITGIARVVMDPVGAHLEPGEILVAPSTDPGWTPLFLTAGGLVMEMGGANSHGAVVAREYGIPAVVGVREAVTRIRTGERITVDGSTGAVTTLDD